MTVITRSDDLRVRNRHRVINAVRSKGPLSRIDIARETGLSAATLTTITAELVEHEMLVAIEESDRPRIGRGRPKTALAINPEMAVVVTTVFKRNTVASAVFDYAGAIIYEQAWDVDTSSLSVGDIQALLERSVASVIETAGSADRLRRIVVGVQGPTDIEGTRLLWSPVIEHRDLPIADWLSDRFGVPVRVRNDCDMIAQSLNWQEPESFGTDFAAILLSYGVGMALFRGGRLANGRLSSAMEFGHMTYMPDGALCRCGKRGCIEAYAGDYAMSRRAKGRPLSDFTVDETDLDEIVASAQAGHADALEALDIAGAALGTGLANLFALTDPLPVALVGAGAKAFTFLEGALRRALRENQSIDQGSKVEIKCFVDEMPIIQHGCAINALLVIDREIVVFDARRSIAGAG
jgi:predicted NBD/HSP70 family sugar kinase